MPTYIALLIPLFIIIVLLKLLKPKRKSKSKKIKNNPAIEPKISFSYKKHSALFTPAERSFLGVLNQSINTEDIQIFGKVRVADIVTPDIKGSRSEWQIAFNAIAAKHFDFVLCDKQDLSILCVIELDDQSHNHPTRQKRDRLLLTICKSANLPLLNFPAKRAYIIDEIKQKISPYLSISAQPTLALPETNLAIKPNQDNIKYMKLCPECQSPLKQHTARTGKLEGQLFWACSTFPTCRYVEKI